LPEKDMEPGQLDFGEALLYESSRVDTRGESKKDPAKDVGGILQEAFFLSIFSA